MIIGKIKGIEIIISDILILLLFGYYYLGILDIALLVFAIVIIHETGHILLSLYWGIRVDTMELFPFGGVARMQNDLYCGLGKQVMIAVMGPLANFILGGLFWLLLNFHIGNPDTITFLIKATLFMGAFNLIPVWPFDGGRIFRAILARWTGFFYALKIVSTLGQVCAIVFFLFGIWQVINDWTNFYWLPIAGFLYYIARKEKRLAYIRFIGYLTHKEKEIAAGGYLPVVFMVARSNVRLKQIVERLVPQKYCLIYVLDDQGKCLGIMTEKTLIQESLKGSMFLTLGEVLNRA